MRLASQGSTLNKGFASAIHLYIIQQALFSDLGCGNGSLAELPKGPQPRVTQSYLRCSRRLTILSILGLLEKRHLGKASRKHGTPQFP